MPLYEYQCEACGHRFEVIQKFSDAPLEACPKCGSRVHKLQSAPAFQFKGTGWYVTDYAKKDQGAAGKSADGKNDDKSEGKTSESSTAADKSEASQKSEKTDKPADSSSSASTTSTPASGTTPAKSS